jgi:hypothetical protein
MSHLICPVLIDMSNVEILHMSLDPIATPIPLIIPASPYVFAPLLPCYGYTLR